MEHKGKPRHLKVMEYFHSPEISSALYFVFAYCNLNRFLWGVSK